MYFSIFLTLTKTRQYNDNDRPTISSSGKHNGDSTEDSYFLSLRGVY